MEALVGQQLGPAACRSGGSRRPSASMRFSRWVKAVFSFPVFLPSSFFFCLVSVLRKWTAVTESYGRWLTDILATPTEWPRSSRYHEYGPGTT